MPRTSSVPTLQGKGLVVIVGFDFDKADVGGTMKPGG